MRGSLLLNLVFMYLCFYREAYYPFSYYVLVIIELIVINVHPQEVKELSIIFS